MVGMNRIVLGNNLSILQSMKTGSVELIYVDPPFNTGKRQSRKQIKTVRDEAGDRIGFGGRAHPTHTPPGSLFFHIDYREVHYCKVMLDEIFGRDCFQNEIIWAYDYGARATKKWPAKHDNFLWYTKHPE